MKGGQKTVGTIFQEALSLLKREYFQTVGVSGIVFAVSLTLSSLYFAVFMVLYFFSIFGAMTPAFMLPIMASFSMDGEVAGALAAVAALVAMVVMALVVMLVVFLVFMAVHLAVTIVVGWAEVGMFQAFLMLLKGDKPAWHAVWAGFRQNWKRFLGISAWMYLWIMLWSLLLFVPGVVKSFQYMLAPWLVLEYPDMPVKQALRKSIEITKGYRGRLFGICMIMYGFTAAASVMAGFLLYFQLAATILWILPLYYVMLGIAYLDIRQAAIENGLLPVLAPSVDTPADAAEAGQPETLPVTATGTTA